MLFSMSLVTSLVLGGIGRRIAGGGLNQWAGLAGGVNARIMGDTPARMIYGALLGLSCLIGGAVWWLALAMVPAVWVGTTTGNFGATSMGNASGHSLVADYAGMTAHAVLSAIVPCAIFAVAAHFAFAPAIAWFAFAWFCILLASPSYVLGWSLSGLSFNPFLPVGFQYGRDIGETLWGAFCGAGAFLAFAL